MDGSYSRSSEEASATGRPASDPLATRDDLVKFLTQDNTMQMDSPIAPFFALERDRYVPGDALYCVRTASS
jgi:hypothetical protein